MPKSDVQAKIKRRRGHPIDPNIKKLKRQQLDWRHRLALPLIIAGAILFLGGKIGALTGLIFLPFDTHHLLAQWGGALIALRGLMWLR